LWDEVEKEVVDAALEEVEIWLVTVWTEEFGVNRMLD
jgi:hypothetical protein